MSIEFARLPPPESWVEDHGVRMLVADEALPHWCGDQEIPEPEKDALAKFVGVPNPSHFAFAHDLVAEKGVELMVFRDRIALLFGYEAKRSAWLPSPNGGTIVQIALSYYGNGHTLNKPEVYRKVLAGAAEAHYVREDGLYFGVDHVEHVLMPAGCSGADTYDFGRLNVSLARGSYEVWSARLACHHGTVDGLYFQLRRRVAPRRRFFTRGGVA